LNNQDFTVDGVDSTEALDWWRSFYSPRSNCYSWSVWIWVNMYFCV